MRRFSACKELKVFELSLSKQVFQNSVLFMQTSVKNLLLGGYRTNKKTSKKPSRSVDYVTKINLETPDTLKWHGPNKDGWVLLRLAGSWNETVQVHILRC